jgi:hypothetical protein
MTWKAWLVTAAVLALFAALALASSADTWV